MLQRRQHLEHTRERTIMWSSPVTPLVGQLPLAHSGHTPMHLGCKTHQTSETQDAKSQQMSAPRKAKVNPGKDPTTERVTMRAAML